MLNDKKNKIRQVSDFIMMKNGRHLYSKKLENEHRRKHQLPTYS